MFSGRVDWELEDNRLTRARARLREAGRPVADLTVSNPTRCDIAYPVEDILAAIAPEAALAHEPEPKGLESAREAVAGYYRSRGESVEPEAIVLTSSTSEACGFLFKLLASPGDEVLVPKPSYPLFDFLASLEGVRPVSYPLLYDGAWHVELGALEEAITPRSRAILAVHPNNPTGSYASAGDRERLVELARERDLALIVDEVFLDYSLTEGAAGTPSFAGAERGLVFVLGGLSKLAGLPQMKLAWIAVGGSRELADEALLRLEHVADQYLSVGGPVSIAAPRLLELAPRVKEQISARTRSNLELATRSLEAEPSVTLLRPEGGWYAPLRLPAIQSGEAWALDFLERASVWVHPGDLFGFAGEAFVVVSLLTPPSILEDGMRGVLGVVSDRMSPPDG